MSLDAMNLDRKDDDTNQNFYDLYNNKNNVSCLSILVSRLLIALILEQSRLAAVGRRTHDGCRKYRI